jgi:hypothetical protein
MVCVKVRTTDRRADEMNCRSRGLVRSFGTSISLTLTDNIVPAQRTAFVLPFPTSIIQTVNQTPVILNSLLQKLNIVKRLVDKSQEEKNRVATPRTNRITPYTQPPRYVKTAKTCVSLRELWDLSLRY